MADAQRWHVERAVVHGGGHAPHRGPRVRTPLGGSGEAAGRDVHVPAPLEGTDKQRHAGADNGGRQPHRRHGGRPNCASLVRATPTADPELTFKYQVTDPRSDTNPDGFVSNSIENDQTQTVRGQQQLRVPTVNDNTDERDGVVTVQLLPGSGYTVGAQDSVTFTVRDNDPGPLGSGSPPPPTIVSIGLAGGGSEGDPVSFSIGASPPPLSPLPVNVTLSDAGNVLNASDAGWRIVEIPPIGSYTLEVPTIDDGVIDVNNVTLTINPGAGYTPGQFASWTVDVQDAGTTSSLMQPPVYNKLTQAQNLTTVAIDPALVANVTAMASQVQHGDRRTWTDGTACWPHSARLPTTTR